MAIRTGAASARSSSPAASRISRGGGAGNVGAFGEPIRGMLVTAYFVGTHIFVGGGRR